MRVSKKALILTVFSALLIARLSEKCLTLNLPVELIRVNEVCAKGVRKDKSKNKDTLFAKIKAKTVTNVKQSVPSPHAELILGMVLGYNDLKSIPRFNDVLVRSGTIHVVVVSGYNINLVFNYLSKLFGTSYQFKNLIILQIFAVIYALITGFEPPIVRALIMCSVFVWSSYYGRKLDVLYVFVITLLFMSIYDPRYIFDISFQLSGGATLGLILYSAYLESLFKNIPLPGLFKQDFLTTISAQVFVWPLISYYFERVSIVSFISNPLTLWIVPIITIIGIFIVLLSFISMVAVTLIWSLISPLSLLFVLINEFLSNLSFAQRDLSITTNHMLFYYLLVFFIPIVLGLFSSKAKQKRFII